MCEVDRTFLSSSLTLVCRLASAAHSPEQLFHTHRENMSDISLMDSESWPQSHLWEILDVCSNSSQPELCSLGGGARIIRGYTSPTQNLPPPSLSMLIFILVRASALASANSSGTSPEPQNVANAKTGSGSTTTAATADR
jgi:hypothetical protein